MEKDQPKTSPDVKAGLQVEADQPPGESRQAASDKSQEDADEQLPEHRKENSVEDPEEVDAMMQGQKLEEKYRGGDATDADEFNRPG